MSASLVVMKSKILFHVLTIVLVCSFISACDTESKEKTRQLVQRGKFMLDIDMAANGKTAVRLL